MIQDNSSEAKMSEMELLELQKQITEADADALQEQDATTDYFDLWSIAVKSGRLRRVWTRLDEDQAVEYMSHYEWSERDPEEVSFLTMHYNSGDGPVVLSALMNLAEYLKQQRGQSLTLKPEEIEADPTRGEGNAIDERKAG